MANPARTRARFLRFLSPFVACACAAAPADRPGEAPDGGAPDATTGASPLSPTIPAVDVPDAGVSIPPIRSEEDAAPDATRSDCADDDEPDDDFVDANCDGIDGDLRRAVFVAPYGADDAPGSLDAPLRSLEYAVAVASATSRDVYVCNGVFEETLRIERGVRLFGGYECGDGRRVRDHAVVAPPAGTPLVIEGVDEPVVIDRVTFEAADATTLGESSVAASVVASADVTLSHLDLRAGDGAPGALGEAVADPRWSRARSGANAPDVKNTQSCAIGDGDCARLLLRDGCATLPANAYHEPTICPDGTEVQGGPGGGGTNALLSAWSVPLTGPHAGLPGTPAATGANARDGAPGRPGSPASRGFGHIEQGRYVPDNTGGPGATGRPGESGTGGSSQQSFCQRFRTDFDYWHALGAAGGQGGYGGCGGAGGYGGGGGGASIALIADHSSVRLTWTRLITGAGGDGGSPSPGQPGQPGGRGGKGGRGVDVLWGEDGGDGGNGGPGGPGGPGGGGPSIGLVYLGAEPTLADVVFELGDAGRGAEGPAEGRGADGIRIETYAAEQGEGE